MNAVDLKLIYLYMERTVYKSSSQMGMNHTIPLPHRQPFLWWDIISDGKDLWISSFHSIVDPGSIAVSATIIGKCTAKGKELNTYHQKQVLLWRGNISSSAKQLYGLSPAILAFELLSTFIIDKVRSDKQPATQAAILEWALPVHHHTYFLRWPYSIHLL